MKTSWRRSYLSRENQRERDDWEVGGISASGIDTVCEGS